MFSLLDYLLILTQKKDLVKWKISLKLEGYKRAESTHWLLTKKLEWVNIGILRIVILGG